MSKESEINRIQHPSIVKVHTNIKDIQKREFENFNILRKLHYQCIRINIFNQLINYTASSLNNIRTIKWILKLVSIYITVY